MLEGVPVVSQHLQRKPSSQEYMHRPNIEEIQYCDEEIAEFLVHRYRLLHLLRVPKRGLRR